MQSMQEDKEFEYTLSWNHKIESITGGDCNIILFDPVF